LVENFENETRHPDAIGQQPDTKQPATSNPKYFRPTEVDILCADITKAKEKLQWEPKVKFEDLVTLMVDHDLEAAKQQSPGKGKEVVDVTGYGWTKHTISLHELIKE